ncbi:hypothetical protein [Subtercola sp. RTI3]|uniref:hypothetical protein n=1 Tax=Subtercola sp. RTI3 TaxID=3048639 RepID=UPI002B22AE35|nr:hypothetical protein [Subtercola sp. RTI3]
MSLADIADGWTDEAFALIRPATYGDRIELTEFTDSAPSRAAQLKYQLDFTKARVVSGKVFVLDDKGQLVLDDYQPGDLDASNELNDKLYLEINGITLDPKDLKTETETSPIIEPSTKP